jgi:hypothetical protein
VIAAHLEPKGLAPDTPALAATFRDSLFRENARRGSLMLRDAILLAKGITPPPVKEEPRPIPVTRAHAHKPRCCPMCGAPTKPAPMLISLIQETVAAYFGLDPSVMQSAQRRMAISHPRQIAMYLASTFTPKSLPEIGRRFGGRDHTTVMHAIKAVKSRMASDPEVELDVEVLKERLAG